MKQQHIPHDQLFLYHMKELPHRERKSIEVHLRTCRQCQAVLEHEKRFLQILTRQSRQEPTEELLQACRNRLRVHLQEESRFKSRKLSWLNIREYVTIRIPVKQLATVIAIFLFGVVLGRFLSLRDSYQGLSSKEAILALQSSMPIGDLQVVPSGEKPGQVEIRFQALQEKRIQGSLNDPDIQYALAYALVNAPHDNIRLKSVQLLQDFPQDESVQSALIHALEKDRNPGIRLKAIRLLKTLPVNDRIKKILVSALFKDSNTGVRIEAANALSQSDDPDILPILQKKAADDDYIKTLISRMNDSKPVSLSRNK